MKSDDLKLVPHLNKNGLKLELDDPLVPTVSGRQIATSINVKATEGEAVIIVDTFSTGALLANLLYKIGYKVTYYNWHYLFLSNWSLLICHLGDLRSLWRFKGSSGYGSRGLRLQLCCHLCI